MNLPAEFKPSTEIQQMMEKLGCTGNRVKPQDIVDRIEEIDFQTVAIAGNKFMYCGIRMKGDFVVVGKPSTCIDPANWRDEIGQQVSFNNTFEEIYKLEAYRKMTAPKPEGADRELPEGFTRYIGKSIVRDAYKLTMTDIVELEMAGTNTNKAKINIGGRDLEFAYHCPFGDIKEGDFVVFLTDTDTYHCEEKVFLERNEV